ncbi:MAG TPA: hypothetical protein PLY09_08490 [Methanothrix sp.]|nr:hypothetical protein [Methanothrix sp.]
MAGIGGQLLARLLAMADPVRPILAGAEASADRAVDSASSTASGRSPADKICLFKGLWRVPTGGRIVGGPGE